MKYKKIFFTICFLIFFISILSVTAADINETQIANPDDNTLIESAQEEAIGDADDGTFTALQKKIDKSAEGSTIILDRNYTYDEGFGNKGILIYKNLTIDGNGHTLNGLSQSRIFVITLGLIHHNKVTLNNIKFVNANTSLYGGAIFNFGNLTVNNCEFTNNYAEYCGGAINSIGYLECKNSKFNNNIADGDGGAIFTLSLRGTFNSLKEILKEDILDGNTDSILSLTNNFTLHYTTEYVSNCTFTNNVANGRGGGAIYAFGSIDIKSSTFTSNKAGEKGGAVFGNKDLFISNSKFTSNQASMYGGAVYFRCHASTGHYDANNNWISEVEYYTNLIQGSTFAKNSASKGGAIYGFKSSSSDKHEAKAVKCIFEANKATTGRDIYGGSASNCVFNYLKLTLKTVTIKKSAKKLVLTATLTKGKTLIKGKTITFKFNGKTYKAKTNAQGIAKITINKNILKKLKVGKTISMQCLCQPL